MKKTKQQLDEEIRAIADIENAFKDLGKKVYSAWLDEETTTNFYTLMENFQKKLTKLEEVKI